MVDGISKKHGFANDVSTLLFARCIFHKLDEKHSVYCSLKLNINDIFKSLLYFHQKIFLKCKATAYRRVLDLQAIFADMCYFALSALARVRLFLAQMAEFLDRY